MKRFLLSTGAFVALSLAAQAEPIKLDPVAISPSEDTLSKGLVEKAVAEGAFTLENPSKYLGTYGYGTDGPPIAPKGAVPAKGTLIEATKTEPDKNTYLVLDSATGPRNGFNYGTHFLFQGHQNGPTDDNGVEPRPPNPIQPDA